MKPKYYYSKKERTSNHNIAFSGLYSFNLYNDFSDFEHIFSVIEIIFKESFVKTNFELLELYIDEKNHYLEFFFAVRDLDIKLNDMRLLPKVLKTRTIIAMKKEKIIDFDWGNTQLLQSFQIKYEECKEEYLKNLAIINQTNT